MGPKPDTDTERTILLLCDDWNNFSDGIVAVNHCLAQTLTRYTGVKVFSTVLKSASEIPAPAKADADKHHVTLISPAENGSRSSSDLHIAFNDDPATLFSNLPDLVARPTHIVGHSPISGEAALKLRDSFYPSSKVILFYHVIPTELDWLHESLPYVVPTDTELVRQAESASVVYSVTEKMHWYYTAKFRNRAQKDVDHRLFLPQCDEEIFNLSPNRVHPRDPARVLNVIPGSGSESWEGTDIATCCLNKVAIASIDGMPTRPSPILTLGAIPEGQLTNIRDSIGALTTSDNLTLNLNSYKTKDDLIQDLSKANLCIVPPRAEPFGCLGLTALSAGIPTLISEDSAVATLVRRLTAEPEYFLVPVTPNACSVRQDSSVWRDRIMTLMQDTEEAHERAQQLRMALRRDECIKETHDNFISFCLGGIHLCHEATELVLIDEKEEERELDIQRQFNSFLLQTLKQCWRMKHHPLARKDDYLLPPGADNTLEGLLKRVTNKIEDRDRRIVGIDETSGSFIVYCPTTDALTDLWAMCDVINNGLVENLLGRHKSQILTHFGLKDVTLRTIISGPEYLQYKREIQLVD